MSDNLAQFGIKKGQVQRAMESLAESQQLVCKVRTASECTYPFVARTLELSHTYFPTGVWKGEDLYASTRRRG